MAALAQKHQIPHGTIGFVPIYVVDSAYHGVTIPPLFAHRQIGSLSKLHPALLTEMISPRSDTGLDQPSFP